MLNVNIGWSLERRMFYIYSRAWPFKRQPHKMVKHTQTIRRQQPTNCLSVFDHFMRLALKGFKFDALVDALNKKKKLTARSADQC